MVKINFKGLVAQFKNRFRLLPVAGAANLYDLVPERGTVTQEGDEITAEAMNQLQANVEQAIDDLQENVAQDMADLEAASGEALKQAQLEADSRYSNALTGTASGAMAHMTDVGIGSLRRLAVRGETRESGTGGKSPTNPYTLAGAMPANATACGKNILSGRASPGSMNGISWTVDADGAIHPTGTATAQANIVLLPDINKPYFWIDKPIFTSADSAKWLTLKVVNKDGVVSWRGIDATQGNMPPYCGILSAYFQYSAGETASGTLYPYIGLEASQPYEPYTGTTAALSSLAPLYGDGTVNDEYDAATGILTKRWNTLVLDSSLSYSMDAGAQHEEYDTIWVQMTSWFAGTSSSNVYCTHLNPVAPLSLWTDDIVGIALATNGRIQMRVPKSIATSVETLKTWLDSQKNAGTPVTVVYPVGTTGVTQHDPVRLVPIAPVCNVYADQGDVDVTYNRDINMAFAALETAMKTLLGGA